MMKKLTSAEVRQMFLDFFKEKGHRVEPSASLIPHDDPSLLWINSGVATLKKYFDGRVVPENPRIVNAQKAIRTNDIENVGKTARHHTFFEMLGNFSVGDYFKKEAIHWAWEFLTDERWIGFDPDRLSVTIYPDDDEAYRIWHEEIGLSENRIIRLEDNFWDIGEGPCGPNTEIFYDRGEKYGNDPNDPELYPGGENERYLEIWNLVFSQYNHQPDGSYTPLPKKNIDTGMGLERMCCVVQQTETNFETDLFLPIIRQMEKIAGKRYGRNNDVDTALKVVADHIRTVTFAVADGALPSNEGRGYVLRRLIRRALRYAGNIGLNQAFMYRLVPVVSDIMEAYYPEIKEKVPFVQKVVEKEENRFHETLGEGLAILKEMIVELEKKGEQVLPGEKAFKLYDTYGFPYELTEEYVEDEGMRVDREGFEKKLAEQRKRARAAREDVQSMQIQSDALREVTVESQFVGYDETECQSEVVAVIQNGKPVDFAPAGENVQLMLKKTPFYAESGGQVADLGTIEGERFTFRVRDVQKAPNGQHLHDGVVEDGPVKTGDFVRARIAGDRRRAIVKNHTATHLLHQALKDVIGQNANQAGSLVAPERLRFDFSHYRALEEEELEKIEQLVNEKIWDQLPVDVLYRSLEEAKSMGAMALFGEKYGDEVRVVRVGDYSLELCGGCHVQNTAEIGLFKIVQESGIGAGTRRIEAVTGEAAFLYMKNQLNLLNEAASLLNTKPGSLPERVKGLLKEQKALERENESLKTRLGNMEARRLLSKAVPVNGISVIAEKVSASDMNQLRQMVDELKGKLDRGVVVLGAAVNGKVQLVAGVTENLIGSGYHAGQLVKEVASRCGGGGGGRPDMAQAGGKEPEKLDEALNTVAKWVESVSS